MNVAALMEVQARRHGDAIAIIERCGRRTFAQLDDESARAARLLADSGIAPGDRVLVLLDVSIDLYVALIAVFRIGAVATFLDPSAGLAHIARCCEMARPAAMIAGWKLHALRIVSRAIRRIPRKFTLGMPLPGAVLWSRSQSLPRAEICALSQDAPALLTFTSGSTGQPKAAVRSHALLVAQQRALERAISLTPGDADLTTLPIFGLANLASGVTTVLADANLRRVGAIDPLPVLRQIENHDIKSTVASPAFLERLLDAPQPARDTLRRLRRIYTGGAPVFADLLQRLASAAPDADVVAVYGSTEAEPIAHVSLHEIAPADLRAMETGAGLIAGVPVDEVKLRVIRSTWGTPIAPMTRVEFDAMMLPPGGAGEIVVTGEHVLKGYLNGVGDETTKFRVDSEIWHRTGDAGRIDEAERLWLLGRAEARIRDERGELWPFAVECAARTNGNVRRCALIAHHGRRVFLVEPISPRDNVTESLKRDLAWAKLDRVVMVASIPVDKRHNAKIDYPALRKMVEQLDP